VKNSRTRFAAFGVGVKNGASWRFGGVVGRQTATSFPLNETDETKAMQALLLQHPLEEAEDRRFAQELAQQ
jgi:hypothetical protein